MLLNSVPVKVNGEDLEIVVNIGSMIEVEKSTGEGFIKVLGKMEGGDLIPLVALLGACLRKDGKPVGTDYIENMFFDEVEKIIDPFMGAIEKAFPKKDSKNVKSTQKTKKQTGTGYLALLRQFSI